jgi:hypothetical protein
VSRYRRVVRAVRAAIFISLLLPGSVVVLAPRPAAAQQGQPVARVSQVIREVLVTQGPGGDYAPVQARQGLANGQGVRTLRRSLAEIAFRDKSVLRLNERTDLVVQDAAQLRHIRLQTGSIWIRVAHGANTAVETPTATATARGTVFVVTVLLDGRTRLEVIEGIVDFTVGDTTFAVGPGQIVETLLNGLLAGMPGAKPEDDDDTPPVDLSLLSARWWTFAEGARYALSLDSIARAVTISIPLINSFGGSGGGPNGGGGDGGGPGEPVTPVEIPEPGTGTLVAAGALLSLPALALRRRRH